MLLQMLKRTKDRIAIEVIDDEGQTLYQRIISRYNERDIRFLARLANWSIAETNNHLNCCCETEDDNIPVAFEDIHPPKSYVESWSNIPPAEQVSNEANQFTLYVREINQLRNTAKVIVSDTVEPCLREAFTYSGVEPILEWTDDNLLSCLDIDYHNIEIRPTHDELASTFDRIKPKPFCWHPSHGNGAKLYYTASPGFTAVELAAIGGFSWLQADPRATFEITKSSRHPCHKRSFDNSPAPCDASTSIYFCYGQTDITPLKRLLSNDVSLEDIHEYLQSKGWHMGQTLPHTCCLIQADSNTKECIFVGERGLFCHRCSAKGMGATGIPGFIPYSTLVGTIDNRLRKMVRNFVHFDHAKVVLSNIYPNYSESHLQSLYRIMLKICHTPDDPRIDMAMMNGKGFLRVRGMWVSTDGEASLVENKLEYVRSLPVTKIPLEDGFTPNVPILTAFTNSCDLSEYGYDDITFIRGSKVYGQFLPYRYGENVKVIVRPEFRNSLPRYIAANKRMPDDEVWGLIESEFPGIDRTYLKLLIATKGAAEGRLCQCPFLLITGPAGSGKSTTPHIAAGICGDKAEEPIWVQDTQRFRQNLMECARHSSFVVINELFKEAGKTKISSVQALTPMLSLTEDSRSWEMYVGQVAFGRLPVFVVTDVNIPQDIKSDVQLARRFTFLQLTQRNYWSNTFVQRGIRAHEFRLISQDHNEAANSLLSSIIDEFFRQPTSLNEITSKLGIKSFEEQSEEITQAKTSLQLFYDAVIDAPILEGSHAKRYKPEKGWKLIDRAKDSLILQNWENVCDGVETNETWGQSRAVDAEDWSALLRVEFPVICEIYRYRPTQLLVRFRSTENHKHPKWINGKLVKP